MMYLIKAVTNIDDWGHPVAQKVAALSYKPAGHGFDSTSNSNEYQEYFLGSKGSQCVGQTI
jgi:hypothetical protein